jgi:hypothetical protein
MGPCFRRDDLRAGTYFRRPCERRDPYGADSRLSRMADAFRTYESQG